MTTISHPEPWSKSFAQPATEFTRTPLSVISGEIPEQLRGTLYRNGPARLSRGGQQVGHWFDGDGAILAVNFAESTAKAIYRYVQTEGYQQETAADAFLYPNYGMTASGGFWQNWLKPVKNAANTSVLALPDRLLALWEGGLPYALNLETLETLGQDNFGGLADKQSFSAHPKVDPITGDIGTTTQTELFKAIAVFDRQTQNLAIADLGADCYPAEPILVPQADNPEKGWLLTVVYDGTNDRSEVRIYLSDRLFDEPVCRLALPSVIPPSFHGTWQDHRSLYGRS